ncbi:L,D-transpeptidase, partial [Pseudooceanicola atlanticus]|uniref:L,D-transpeptidase n=1 Tax=Pseudooceanicola atlanticus TaxID=1461694 RepID=UPI0012E01E9A
NLQTLIMNEGPTGGRSLRIHGTPSPRSIGGRASSGCVRMVMAHINDLYPNVAVGSTAFLYSAEDSVTARS